MTGVRFGRRANKPIGSHVRLKPGAWSLFGAWGPEPLL